MSLTQLQESRAGQQSQEYYRVLMVSGIYPTQDRPHKGTFVKAIVDPLRELGHTVDIIHPDPRWPSPLRYAWATLQVFARTLGGRYDIVHGHYGLWCLAARMQWRAAVVAAFLGDDLLGTVTFDGSYSKKSLLVVRISQWLCRHAEAVTVKSEQMMRATLIDDAIVLPDGINFELFHPMPREEARTRLGWDLERQYIVFANSPDIPVKNFALARAAVDKLNGRGTPAELKVAWGLPQEKVVEYINASNALILTSVAEGSPNVVREAMACNIPVVSTDVGDVADVLIHTDGCSVCPHDADALAEGLEKALQHTERTTGRVDSAHLASEVLVHAIVAMYEQAIEKKRRGKRRPGTSRIGGRKEEGYARS